MRHMPRCGPAPSCGLQHSLPLLPIPTPQVPDGPDGAQQEKAQTKGGGSKAETSRRAQLASAVGLSQLVLPFWSGATWDKQHGVDVERKRWGWGLGMVYSGRGYSMS